MPIVFVHGVNTRNTEPGYDARVAMVSKYLQKHLTGTTIGGKKLTQVSPRFPYWGDLATQFAWNMASLPQDKIDSLGAPVSDEIRSAIAVLVDGLASPSKAQREPLLTFARERSLAEAVDLVADLVLRETNKSEAEETAASLIALRAYAEANPKPQWLLTATTDEQLLGLLQHAVKKQDVGVQSLGSFDGVFGAISAAAGKLKNAVQAAAGTVVDRVGDFASTRLLAWQRRSLNENLGRFFGDVFIYLDGRGDQAKPGAIPTRVLEALDGAQALAPSEPLVIIGHSLGGVITYDLLSHFRPNLKVDLLVTVGSQVSHFEEIKQFKASDHAIRGPKKAATSQNIARWLNVLDEVDIFSYACEKVFDRVTDFHYDTKTYVIKAHSAYFDHSQFYERLRVRIEALP